MLKVCEGKCLQVGRGNFYDLWLWDGDADKKTGGRVARIFIDSDQEGQLKLSGFES